ILQSTLAGANHVVEIGMIANRQNVTILRFRASCLRTINVNVGFAKYAGSRERGKRVLAQSEGVLCIYFHGHFDRGERTGRDNQDVGYIPDVNTTQTNRGSIAKPAGVVKVRLKCDLPCEPSARTRHQQNQDAERHHREYYGKTYTQLGPFQLLLTWH